MDRQGLLYRKSLYERRQDKRKGPNRIMWDCAVLLSIPVCLGAKNLEWHRNRPAIITSAAGK